MAKKKTLDLLSIINPTPKQETALKMIKKSKYFLYGGAMGGGKSYLLRWALVALLVYYWQKYNLRNVTVGLFCEDYPALKDRHINKIQFEFPEWLGKLNKADHEFKLNPEYGGGILALRNLDDPSKYASAEFAAIGVDELTKNQLEMFQFLRTRMRWAGLPAKEWKFMAGTNPGSIGHAWVKKIWMDKEFEPEMLPIANEFSYLKALAEDNPHIDEGYMKTLDSLPEKLRKAYKEGDWDIFAGQYFNEWRRQYNTCEPFPIPDYWMRFLSIDYGYAHQSAVYWAALDTMGRVIVYRELYGAGYTYKALARKILEMTPEKERPMLEGNMVADPAIFAKKGEDSEEKSGAEIMAEATNNWLLLRRANNERVVGWGIMRDYMRTQKIGELVTSRLIYFNTCPNAIRTIPAMVHSETIPEDVDKKGEDHAGDSGRYLLMDIHETSSEKPKEIKSKKTTDDIFENDMYWERMKREEEKEDLSWMNI